MEKKKGGKKTYAEKRKKRLSIIALAIVVLFIFWTVAGSLMSVWADTEEPSGHYVAGLYVATAYGLDFPSQKTTNPALLKADIDKIVSDAAYMNMNTMVFQVNTGADVFYKSNYYPWSRYLSGTQGVAPADGFDPLEYMVQKCHENNIRISAWINPYMITRGSGSTLESLAADNPARTTLKDYVVLYNGNYYFDPASPEVRSYIVDSVKEIIENYDVDGIHMDDYFYPGTDFDDTASWVKYGAGYSDQASWRRANVNELVKTLDHTIHEMNPKLRFGISPTGIWGNASTTSGGSATSGLEHYNARFCDSVTWVKNGWVDYIEPQIYWNIGYSKADYSVLVDWWNSVVTGTDVDLCIAMADHRSANVTDTSSVWYGNDEIQRQLDLNDTYPSIIGEVHFRYKLLVADQSLMDLYRSYYPVVSNNTSTDPAADPTTGPVTNPEAGQTTEPAIQPADPVVEPPAQEIVELNDIKDHWAESYIKSLVNDGIISGMGDGTFDPDGNLTRAQFVKLIAGLDGGFDAQSVSDAGFKDVYSTDWFAPYVNWAAQMEIVNGTGDGSFHPNDQITREQMAVILANIANSAEIGFPQTQPVINFFDAQDIDSWALDSVNYVVRSGIISGILVTDGYGGDVTAFRPLGVATRAQAAKVIYMVKQIFDQV